MNGTPKALRLHIGIFGRANTGKSSFLNLVTGQRTSIVSPVAGTTADVVRKSMELLPLGPVTFLDTAGVDDDSGIGPLRVERTREALASSDVAVMVLEAPLWTESEASLEAACAAGATPLILVVNKADREEPRADWLDELRRRHGRVMPCSCARAAADPAYRESVMVEFKRLLLEACPDGFLEAPPLLEGLLPEGGAPAVAALVVPVDSGAPKGRLILPQVQAIRAALDARAAVLVMQDTQYRAALGRLSSPPDLVVCDSQVAEGTVRDTPPDVPCTTFSILFSRCKSDIDAMAAGAATLSRLRPGDRVLVSEACTHHPLEDDIGRVKIPRWIREKTGYELQIDHRAGKDYPEDLSKYSLIIHCGACTLTRREMMWRMERARSAGVPITNYGMAISALRGVLERTLEPFPSALRAYRAASV